MTEQPCRYCGRPIEESPDTRNRWAHKPPPGKEGTKPEKASARCADGKQSATPLLRPGEAKELRRLVEHRDNALAVLGSLDAATLLDLMRRARYGVRDGFPVGATGMSDVHGARLGTPTEEFVLAVAGGSGADPDTWQSPDDRVRVTLMRIFDILGTADALAAELRHKRDYVLSLRDRAREESRGLPGCANPHCTDLADPGKGGRCSACCEYKRTNDREASAETCERRWRRRTERASA